MNVLIPITITDAMLTSSTVAEPAAGETAWVASTAYVLGDRRIRTTTHKVYECVQAHTSRTALPEVDTAYWLEYGPTLKWAAFEEMTSTKSSATTTLSYVLRPGFFNAIALYGMEAASLSITLKDAPGGTVVDSRTIDLSAQPRDFYDWAFGGFKPLASIVASGFLPYPDPELTITLTVATGATVKAGIIAVGDMSSLAGDGEWGGTQYGAKAEPVSYSYIKRNDDGTTKIVRRHAATDMNVSIILPREFADAAVGVVQSVLDKPVAWIATQATGYESLSVFGLGSGSMSYDSFGIATLSINVKGLI